MLALLSMPYVYPYAHIIAPIMIAFLVACILLFYKFPTQRKRVLFALFVGGLIEVFNGAFSNFAYTDGIVIGLLTLTCVGFLLIINFLKTFTFRYISSLPFLALGGYLLFVAYNFTQKAEVSFVYFTNLTAWLVLVSWALTSLGCGILLLIAATRSLFASRY